MTRFKIILSTGATAITYLLGGFDKLLLCLIIAMGLDYLTGILKAIKLKKLNSEIGRKGIVKKIYYLCIVGLAVVIDNVSGQTGIVRNFMCYYIIANEGLSIIENGAQFGFKVPEIIKDKLEQLKKQ